MGGQSSSTTNQSQTSQLAPYAPAQGALNGILGSLTSYAPDASKLTGGQTGALDKIEANANGTPNYNPAINSGTMGLLNGGGANNNNGAIAGNLGILNNGIVGQTASGANIGGNPALKAQLGQIATDTTNSVNGNWAAAGRDGSPGNMQALGRGIAAGEAPVIAQQYNTDTTNALNAGKSMYDAGNTTYGILNGNQAQANQNFTNGVGTVGAGINAQNAAPNSILQAEASRWGIPIQQLQTLLGSISPIAAQFGTQTGTGTGSTTNQMSGAQQFALLGQGANGLGNLGSLLFGA